jgi:hypothetical protein
MIQDRIIAKWTTEIESELDRMAHSAMGIAKGEPFEHGISVGEYRGLQKARQILDEVIKDLDI